jgi:hypothetical protein
MFRDNVPVPYSRVKKFNNQAFFFDYFWYIRQRGVIVLSRRFGTTCPSHLQGPRGPRRKPLYFDLFTLEYGTDRLFRNVATELPLTLRNIPEECGSHLYSGGSLKSHPVGHFTIKCVSSFIYGPSLTLLVAGREMLNYGLRNDVQGNGRVVSYI